MAFLISLVVSAGLTSGDLTPQLQAVSMTKQHNRILFIFRTPQEVIVTFSSRRDNNVASIFTRLKL
jgi:hypothetical protein